MLISTEIVTLFLVLAEVHDAVQQKSQQAAGASGRRGNSQRALSDYNYVAMGADGAAEVAFKVDMSMFMERLNMIPELGQVVANLAEKVEILYQIGVGNGQSGGGLDAQIISLEQSILARLEQQDITINAMYQMIQQFQAEFGTINQAINQVLMIVQGWPSGPFGGNGTDDCARGVGVIEGLIRQMMTTFTQVVGIIEQFRQPPGSDLSGPMLDIVQQNFRSLQQITVILEQLGQRIGTNNVSCPKTGGSNELQILQDMNAMMALIEGVPQQILIVLQNNGLLGGSNGALVQYLQNITQLCETVINEVVGMRNFLIEVSKELRKHFAESQKSLVAVKKVVTETTEMVQSSAAAASSAAAVISASRNMNCPTGNSQKPDLDN